MSRTPLTTLAVLRTYLENGTDYIDLFVPFVVEALRQSPRDGLSIRDLLGEVRQAFDLHIPEGALRTIVHRASRKSLCRVHQGKVWKVQSEHGGQEFVARRTAVDLTLAKLAEAFVAFSSTQFRRRWSPAEAQAVLTAFLAERAPDVLRAMSSRSRRWRDVDHARTESDFIAGRFILVILESSDVELREQLRAITEGSMLAGALLFRDISAVNRRFKDVDVYFDTRFLIQAFGWEGVDEERARRELLDLLHVKGARLKVFRHTVEEIHGVIAAVRNALKAPRRSSKAYGPTLRAVMEAGKGVADVEMMMSEISTKLAALNIVAVDAPPYEEYRYVPDEADLKFYLQKHIPYMRDEAVDHDVASYSAIIRMRRGRVPVDIESCVALFVTTNRSLVRWSSRYWRAAVGVRRAVASVPPVVSSDLATTIAWLKEPGLFPTLPTQKIVADCLAVLEPTSELWGEVLKELDRLEDLGDVTADEAMLIAWSPASRNAVMQETLGTLGNLKAKTLPKVIEAAREAIREEYGREFRAELAKYDNKLKSARQELEAAKRREKEAWLTLDTEVEAIVEERVSSAEKRFEEAQKELAKVLELLAESARESADLRHAVRRREERIRQVATSWSRRARHAVWVLIALIVVAALVTSFVALNGIFAYVGFALAGIVAVLFALDHLLGWDAITISSKFEVRIRIRIERWLRKLLD